MVFRVACQINAYYGILIILCKLSTLRYKGQMLYMYCPSHPLNGESSVSAIDAIYFTS